MSLKFLEVINYEGGNDVLVWKHPCEDFNTGSHLIVHESQEAIFMCNGKALDLLGPGRHDLKTGNIPLLRRLLNIPTGGVSPFHCEIYYINKSIPMDLKWGTPDQIIAMDPQFHILIHAGANGGMGVQIEDSRKLLVKFSGTNRKFTTETLMAYFREMITVHVKSHLTTLLSQVSFTIVNAHLNEMSSAMHEVLGEEMEEFGVKLIKFFVSGIRLDDGDYQKIQSTLSDASALGISSMAEKQRMDLLGYNWSDEHIAEIAIEYAKNPGSSNNVGGMIAQMPLALGFGQMLRGATKPLMDQAFSQPPKAFTQGASAPVATGESSLFSGVPVSPFGKAPNPLRPKAATQSSDVVLSNDGKDESAKPEQFRDDPVTTLQKLKTMLDAGLIPQEVYDKKMQEILNRM